LALIVVIITSCHFYLKSKIPIREGIQVFSELKDKVEVYTDKIGIAHISGKNAHDTYFALGVHMASHRLFQMEILKRVVRGELSEVFGKEFLEVDKMMRTFGFFNNAKKMRESILKKTNPNAIIEIKAFLKGINSFQKKSSLPIEFQILDIIPTEFLLEDIIGLSGYMSLTFAEGVITDLTLYNLKSILTPKHIKTLLARTKNDKTLYVCSFFFRCTRCYIWCFWRPLPCKNIRGAYGGNF
jgi:penicillin amidase